MNLLRKRNGFSLIEVIIVAAIAVGVLFVIVSLRGNVGNLENVITQKLASRQDIEQTMQILVTEVRSASPASNGAYAIESASTSSISFYSDIDGDKVYERVRYSISTSTISRGVIEPTGNPLQYVTSTEVVTTVVRNLVNVTSTAFLTYYDSNYTGSETAMTSPIDLTKIRVVRVSFYVDIVPGKSPKPVFFSSSITVRNLRSN